MVREAVAVRKSGVRWLLAAAIATVPAGAMADGGDDDFPAQAADVRPLTKGDPAPAAVVRDPDGHAVDLRDVYSRAPTALIFYRGGWCAYCTRQLRDLRHAEAPLRELRFQIVAVSPDRPEELRRTMGEETLGYRLVSDSRMDLARKFGLAFRVGRATALVYRVAGIDLEKSSGESHRLLPVPAVYLIDTAGTIGFAHWDADYKKRLGHEDLIAAARAMQTAGAGPGS